MPDPEQAHGEHGGGAPAAPEAAKSAPTALAGLVALVLLAALFAIWAWQFGGWFGTALYPGAAVLAIGLILLALFAPTRVRLRGWPALALGGIIGLGLWSALSALWSPSPDIAIEDAQRILTYAMAFGLGLWLCDLLGARMHLAMAPLAFAALFAGALATAGLLGGEDLSRYLDEGTFQYPIGYRNANAAFFLIAMWPAVGLAATRELDWRLRAISLGTATICLELGILGQSRASIIAGAVALVVYLAASRDRARATAWLILAILPSLVVVPALSDLFHAADELGRQQTLDELHAAGRAVVLGAGLAVILGGAAALLGRRFPVPRAALERADRAVAVGAIGIALVGFGGFVVATGDPLEWVGDRWQEFQSQDTPDTTGASSRFGFNAGTERDDVWRVALDDAGADPVFGTGGGGYYYSYLRGRSEEGPESVRDAHSVELEFLGELGVPGLALLALALVGAFAGALRARRTGPAAAALSTCALTAGAYWLAHSSLDWFWSFPAVTAPVLALLGSASAPAFLQTRSSSRGPGRRLILFGAALLALSVVPPYLSERYVNQAYESWGTDREGAFEDLDRARTLNPLDEDPLIAEGAIARAAGERAHAIEAFERAAQKRPEEWATHYFLATLQASENPAAARRELEIAAEQNPLSLRIKAALRQLDREERSPHGG